MKISIIGSGCPTCKKLYETVKKIVKDNNSPAKVEYSDDITLIAELGLLQSPAILVDGKPVSPASFSKEDIKTALCEVARNGSDNPPCCSEGCS